MKISIKREQSQTGLSFAEREKFGPKVKKIFQWALAAALICGSGHTRRMLATSRL